MNNVHRMLSAAFIWRSVHYSIVSSFSFVAQRRFHEKILEFQIWRKKSFRKGTILRDCNRRHISKIGATIGCKNKGNKFERNIFDYNLKSLYFKIAFWFVLFFGETSFRPNWNTVSTRKSNKVKNCMCTTFTFLFFGDTSFRSSSGLRIQIEWINRIFRFHGEPNYLWKKSKIAQSRIHFCCKLVLYSFPFSCPLSSYRI